MTYKNRIWKLVSSSTPAKAISILKRVFPSMSIEVVDYSSTPPVISEVSTKEEALNRLRMGLKKITEIEAEAYLEKINKKERSSQIKF